MIFYKCFILKSCIVCPCFRESQYTLTYLRLCFKEVFVIQCFSKFLFSPHRILLLGIKYSIQYLLGKLLNISHEALNDLDSAWLFGHHLPLNSSHLLYSLVPLKHWFSALGPSSSCCFFLVFFKTFQKSLLQKTLLKASYFLLQPSMIASFLTLTVSLLNVTT